MNTAGIGRIPETERQQLISMLAEYVNGARLHQASHTATLSCYGPVKSHSIYVSHRFHVWGEALEPQKG